RQLPRARRPRLARVAGDRFHAAGRFRAVQIGRSMLTQSLLEDSRAIADRIVALRRAIHAEPELGLETPKTLAKVKADLADLPLEWREGPSCTGAVAVLNRGKAGRSVLLRGDMDALPMDEHTGL